MIDTFSLRPAGGAGLRAALLSDVLIVRA